MDSFRKFVEDTWLSLIILIGTILIWIFRNEKSEIDKKLDNTIDKDDLLNWEKNLLLKIDKNINEIKHGFDLRLTTIEQSFKNMNEGIASVISYKHSLDNEKAGINGTIGILKDALKEANKFFSNTAKRND